MIVAELARDKQLLHGLLANSERKHHLAEAAIAELKEKLASARAELKIWRTQKHAQFDAPNGRNDGPPDRGGGRRLTRPSANQVFLNSRGVLCPPAPRTLGARGTLYGFLGADQLAEPQNSGGVLLPLGAGSSPGAARCLYPACPAPGARPEYTACAAQACDRRLSNQSRDASLQPRLLRSGGTICCTRTQRRLDRRRSARGGEER